MACELFWICCNGLLDAGHSCCFGMCCSDSGHWSGGLLEYHDSLRGVTDTDWAALAHTGTLAADPRLSEIFDQVIETASEFSGSGPVEGPGSEVSDSIPARLSDGEFVITAKATKEIGADNLMSMMKDAEAAADERQMAYNGGPIREEKEVMATPQEPVQQNINVTKTTLDSSSAMQLREEDPVKKAVKENMMLDPYQKHVRS